MRYDCDVSKSVPATATTRAADERLPIEFRLATLSDIPALDELIPLSARTLQLGYYSAEQIEGAIGTIFGVDSQLIRDGTYYVAVVSNEIVGCGGWSKRQTPYGSDRAKQGADPLRDPATEPAMIRAFFVHPSHARRGIGKKLMELSETAASAAGFGRIEIVATLPGVPLYRAFEYEDVERFDITLVNGARMPLVRMRKREQPLTSSTTV
jgi:GNAT superfamily N-acetyltransferase